MASEKMWVIRVIDTKVFHNANKARVVKKKLLNRCTVIINFGFQKLNNLISIFRKYLFPSFVNSFNK